MFDPHTGNGMTRACAKIAVPARVLLCRALLRCAARYLCYAMLCYAMLRYAMLCYAMLCHCAVLFSATLSSRHRLIGYLDQPVPSLSLARSSRKHVMRFSKVCFPGGLGTREARYPLSRSRSSHPIPSHPVLFATCHPNPFCCVVTSATSRQTTALHILRSYTSRSFGRQGAGLHFRLSHGFITRIGTRESLSMPCPPMPLLAYFRTVPRHPSYTCRA